MSKILTVFFLMLALTGIHCGGSTTGNPPTSSLPTTFSVSAE